MKCPKCGRVHDRTVCPYCLRTARWERLSLEEQLPGLPPRMYQELNAQYHLEHSINLRDSQSYFCHGPANTGKTVFCVYLLYELAKQHFVHNKPFRFLFIPLNEMYDQIISRKVDRQVFMDVDYLVIDEIGIEHNHDALYSILYGVVNHRYNWLKPMSFTSNLSLLQIKDKMQDERLIRRISATCKVLKFNNPYYGN